MYLSGSKSEIMNLVSNGVLKMKNKDEYYIEAKSNSGNEPYIILVSISDLPEKSNNSQEINVEDFLKAFPTPSEAKVMLLPINGILNRSLRTGTKSKMQLKLNNFCKNHPNVNIIDLVKHEVKKRVTTSLRTNRNELQFMRASEAWLNDDANIDSLIDEVYNNKEDYLTTDNSIDFNFV